MVAIRSPVGWVYARIQPPIWKRKTLSSSEDKRRLSLMTARALLVVKEKCGRTNIGREGDGESEEG